MGSRRACNNKARKGPETSGQAKLSYAGNVNMNTEIKVAWHFYCVNGKSGTMVMPCACDAVEALKECRLSLGVKVVRVYQLIVKFCKDNCLYITKVYNEIIKN